MAFGDNTGVDVGSSVGSLGGRLIGQAFLPGAGGTIGSIIGKTLGKFVGGLLGGAFGGERPKIFVPGISIGDSDSPFLRNMYMEMGDTYIRAKGDRIGKTYRKRDKLLGVAVKGVKDRLERMGLVEASEQISDLYSQYKDVPADRRGSMFHAMQPLVNGLVGGEELIKETQADLGYNDEQRRAFNMPDVEKAYKFNEKVLVNDVLKPAYKAQSDRDRAYSQSSDGRYKHNVKGRFERYANQDIFKYGDITDARLAGFQKEYFPLANKDFDRFKVLKSRGVLDRTDEGYKLNPGRLSEYIEESRGGRTRRGAMGSLKYLFPDDISDALSLDKTKVSVGGGKNRKNISLSEYLLKNRGRGVSGINTMPFGVPDEHAGLTAQNLSYYVGRQGGFNFPSLADFSYNADVDLPQVPDLPGVGAGGTSGVTPDISHIGFFRSERASGLRNAGVFRTQSRPRFMGG